MYYMCSDVCCVIKPLITLYLACLHLLYIVSDNPHISTCPEKCNCSTHWRCVFFKHKDVWEAMFCRWIGQKQKLS